MTRLQRLEQLMDSTDPEAAHAEADMILLTYCPKEIQEAFEKIKRYYA